MTYSICVREEHTDNQGIGQMQYGVAVTTRRPAVGAVTPHVSSKGAVATQAVTNPSLGERGLIYIDEGLTAADSLQALLNVDRRAPYRQLHGVSADSSFTHTGTECDSWCGHIKEKGITVAGNQLTGENVLTSVYESYLANDRSQALEVRLINALEAGYNEGGDKRTDELSIQSASVRVERTEPSETRRTYSDIRVDATVKPMEELRATYLRAKQGHEEFLNYREGTGT